jgi:hypothetical protein
VRGGTAPRCVLDESANVLIVEQDPDVGERIARALSASGARVARATTPLDAVVQIVSAPSTLRVVVVGGLAEEGAADALLEFSAAQLRSPLLVVLEGDSPRAPRESSRASGRRTQRAPRAGDFFADVDARLRARAVPKLRAA